MGSEKVPRALEGGRRATAAAIVGRELIRSAGWLLLRCPPMKKINSNGPGGRSIPWLVGENDGSPEGEGASPVWEEKPPQLEGNENGECRGGGKEVPSTPSLRPITLKNTITKKQIYSSQLERGEPFHGFTEKITNNVPSEGNVRISGQGRGEKEKNDSKKKVAANNGQQDHGWMEHRKRRRRCEGEGRRAWCGSG
jgi:hypothetical protein